MFTTGPALLPLSVPQQEYPRPSPSPCSLLASPCKHPSPSSQGLSPHLPARKARAAGLGPGQPLAVMTGSESVNTPASPPSSGTTLRWAPHAFLELPRGVEPQVPTEVPCRGFFPFPVLRPHSLTRASPRYITCTRILFLDLLLRESHVGQLVIMSDTRDHQICLHLQKAHHLLTTF